MLKKIILLSALLYWGVPTHAANLLEVYQQALCSDPLFQQVIAQTLITKDNVPISISYLLPNISLFTDPTITRSGFYGTEFRTGRLGNINFFDPRHLTQRTYNLDLTLTQPVFDFSLYANVSIQRENAKSACATLNAALQDLMVRVAKAYFAVLRDEEEVIYTLASKRYYFFQLKQIKDQYQAGTRTLTDVYTAKGAYETSVATYIAAQKRLANDRENLRVITNVYYPHLSYLKNDLPLISPPNNINQWVDVAIRQNWSIKAAQYSLQAAKQNIKFQFAGHLPTVVLQTNFNKYYTFNINRYPSYIDANGAGTISEKALGFIINVPFFEGGGVVSKTQQARHFYQLQCQILEETLRNVTNDTRQSFMNIIAGISQLKADVHVINAAIESLQGIIDRYNAGIQTLLDVLNREESLYEAQIIYATDRYEYIINLLTLKEAAGTLNFEDLRVINSWLINEREIKPYQDTLLHNAQNNIQQNFLHHKITGNKNSSNKTIAQRQTNLPPPIIAQIQEETKLAYNKLERQNQQSNREEIAALKAALAEIKQDLQNKNNHTRSTNKSVSRNRS